MNGWRRIEHGRAEKFQRVEFFSPRSVPAPPSRRLKPGLSISMIGISGFLFVAYLGITTAKKSHEAGSTINATNLSQSLPAETKSSLKMTIISLSENRNTAKLNQIRLSTTIAPMARFNEPKVEAKKAERWSATNPELVRAASKLNILRNPITGLVQIGEFSTFTIRSDQQKCETFREILLNKVDGNERSFNVIADTGFIYIARLCAQNGSVILSCRNGQMTLSTRKPRPDDKCSGLVARK